MLDWLHSPNPACFVCGKVGTIVRLQEIDAIACKYCSAKVTMQALLYAEPKFLIDCARKEWEHRKKVASKLSKEALLDILSQVHGFVISMPPQSNPTLGSIYANYNDNKNKLKELFLKELGGSKEPEWSYEEAAASEFNIDSGLA